MTQDQKNQIMPLVTALLFIGIVFLALRSEDRIFQNNGRLEISREGDAVVLEWRSQVEVPMARRFEEAFAAHRYETDHFIIDLNSPGGFIVEGENVINQIAQIKRTHRVDTRIGNGRACYSMCVPIFLQGENRIAAANARFMFHEPSARDMFTEEKIERPDFEQRFDTARFVQRHFVNSPMDAAWREALVSEWQGRDVYKSARELADEEAGIITALQ